MSEILFQWPLHHIGGALYCRESVCVSNESITHAHSRLQFTPNTLPIQLSILVIRTIMSVTDGEYASDLHKRRDPTKEEA